MNAILYIRSTFKSYNTWLRDKNGKIIFSVTDSSNNKTTIEKRYYISSLNININDFSKAIRNHWSVENKLHWHLDFTFKEDKNTTSNKKALMNLQLVNKFCLGILNKIKQFHGNVSLRRIKKRMNMNFEKWLIRNICYLILS